MSYVKYAVSYLGFGVWAKVGVKITVIALESLIIT